jgi:hypothetical protein
MGRVQDSNEAGQSARECRAAGRRLGWRFGVGDQGRARRVVTQRNPTSARGVRPAGLLRASARLAANASILLQRWLPGGHASRAGPRTQVFGPQEESRTAEASAGVRRRGQEATGLAVGESRCSTIQPDHGPGRGSKNRGRRLWAGRRVSSTFAAIFGGCRA